MVMIAVLHDESGEAFGLAFLNVASDLDAAVQVARLCPKGYALAATMYALRDNEMPIPAIGRLLTPEEEQSLDLWYRRRGESLEGKENPSDAHSSKEKRNAKASVH